MSDQVLSDEQRLEHCSECDSGGLTFDYHFPSKCHHVEVRNVERAVVSALAARSGVDVEAQLQAACPIYRATRNPDHVAKCSECQRHVGIVKIALTTAEARHAQDLQSMADTCAASRADWQEREAMWRELIAYGSYGFCPEPCRHNYCLSIRELRAALGLEG